MANKATQHEFGFSDRQRVLYGRHSRATLHSGMQGGPDPCREDALNALEKVLEQEAPRV